MHYEEFTVIDHVKIKKREDNISKVVYICTQLQTEEMTCVALTIRNGEKNYPGHAGGGETLRNTCCYAPQNCYPCRGTVGIDDLLFFRNWWVVAGGVQQFYWDYVPAISGIFSDVSDAQGACQAITDMIYSSQVATPDNMELMYQLYALASRKPLLKR